MHHAGAAVAKNIKSAICRSRNKCAFTQTAARLTTTRSLLKHRIKLKNQGERRAQHRSVGRSSRKDLYRDEHRRDRSDRLRFYNKARRNPAPLNYEGFPKSVCTSLNNEVCHGIPDKDIILKEGDIINVDVSTILDGYFSDASRMFTMGNISDRAKRIVKVTEECVARGLTRSQTVGTFR